MKAVFFKDKSKNKAQDILSLLPHNLEVFFAKEELNLKSAKEAVNADIISVFVNSEVTKELMDKMPKLKLIATSSTGFDHIDIDYAHKKGLTVTNVPSYGSQTVAEFAMGLILCLSRKILVGDRLFEKGLKPPLWQLEGFDLENKTLGVIGTGKIG